MHPDGVSKEGVSEKGVPLVNNHDWFKDWTFIDFLREVGKHFRVNTMIAKDSVRNRLENREQGISFTEFSYMLIQGYDFLHLFKEHGCQLQIGGSDQWGNITAGTDLIRKKEGEAAFGLTMPLLTSSSGQKFGKTEKGAVWLSAERTSAYEFFQYWTNRDDAEIEMLLKTFTFLPREEVEALVEDVAQGRNRGQVQKRLAHELTWLVHGREEADKAARASKMLFGERIEGLSDRDLSSIFADVPSTQLASERFEGEGVSLIDLFAEVGLQPSKGAARRLVKQGGGYVNNARVDGSTLVTKDHLASESMIVLRAGKKSYHVLKLV
jgi:tyrosyl-tRNA synthetase